MTSKLRALDSQYFQVKIMCIYSLGFLASKTMQTFLLALKNSCSTQQKLACCMQHNI